MGAIIEEIKIPNNLYSFISNDGENLNILKNLSKINIFVGENNSGKSRFLRSLLAELDFKPDTNEIKEINSKLSELRKISTSEAYEISTGFNLDYYAQNIEFLRTNGYLAIYKAIEELEKIIGSYDEKEEETYDQTDYYICQQSKSILKKINELFSEEKIFKPFKSIYIPILRGLRSIECGTAIGTSEGTQYYDVYKMRTHGDYFKDISDDFRDLKEFEIFTGLNIYDIFKRYTHGDFEKREVIDEFRKYLSEKFFEGKEVLLIPKLNDNVLTVKIGNEKEKPIYHLGDGIQSVIMMIFPLFLYENEIKENENALIFIEEPEYLLHPGLQRKLIETFCDKRFNNYQFFFTTHSNHFLDITLDFENISIFTFKKLLEGANKEIIPKFSIENLTEGNAKALESLGVRNSSVFLSNSTIWVEGITDRYYIKKYLEVFQNYLKKHAEELEIPFTEFREDYHYSFIEYAGSNITHWSFLEGLDTKEKMNIERICSRIFLIADKDNENKKIKRKEKLRENLKERYCELECKEIENLLSKDILLKTVMSYENVNFKEAGEYFNDEFDEESYKNICLGEFIEKTILNGKKRRSGSYQVKNKKNKCVTITDKLKFCKTAISNINNIEDLSNEALVICNRIYRFIAKENGFNDFSAYEALCEELQIPKYTFNREYQKIEKKDIEEGA
jgi:predicted ATP-dependent endonuclease of OLD family